MQKELYIVHEDDSIIHFISLESCDDADIPHVPTSFYFSPMYAKNDKNYNEITDTVLGPLKRPCTPVEQDVSVLPVINGQRQNIA